MEVSLAFLAEVAGMTAQSKEQKVSNRKSNAPSCTPESWHLLFHHHDPVMVHATSVTATGRMLSVTADPAVSHGHVTPHTSSFLQPCYLYSWRKKSVSDAEAVTQTPHLPFLFVDRFNNNHFTN